MPRSGPREEEREGGVWGGRSGMLSWLRRGVKGGDGGEAWEEQGARLALGRAGALGPHGVGGR